jgi:hypothetical protein
MKMPITIKMAGLIALFQKGFFAAELPALVIAPPNLGSQISVGVTLLQPGRINHKVKYVF